MMNINIVPTKYKRHETEFNEIAKKLREKKTPISSKNQRFLVINNGKNKKERFRRIRESTVLCC